MQLRFARKGTHLDSGVSDSTDSGVTLYMPTDNSHSSRETRDRVVAEALRDREKREKTYREKALKMFPWVCGKCGREFSGKRLRELTVHHKDHNHDNNPPDGSNWELLCLYCHDNEHSRHAVADAYGEESPGETQASSPGHNPFADLAAMLEAKKK